MKRCWQERVFLKSKNHWHWWTENYWTTWSLVSWYVTKMGALSSVFCNLFCLFLYCNCFVSFSHLFFLLFSLFAYYISPTVNMICRTSSCIFLTPPVFTSFCKILESSIVDYLLVTWESHCTGHTTHSVTFLKHSLLTLHVRTYVPT